MTPMRIAVGCDHVALAFKTDLIDYLRDLGHQPEDLGTFNAERTDYPRYAEAVATAVVAGTHHRGLLCCGTGIGISIAANKVPGIRAVVCSEPYSAVLSRQHNDTNVLAMGARVVGVELARMILGQWLATDYEGGRHQHRLDLIARLERGDSCD